MWDRIIVWFGSMVFFKLRSRIARMQGGQELGFSASAELGQTTIQKVWSRPPISMDFQVSAHE